MKTTIEINTDKDSSKDIRLMEEYFICPNNGNQLSADETNERLINAQIGVYYKIENNVINFGNPVKINEVDKPVDLNDISEMHTFYDSRFKKAAETNSEIYGDFESNPEIVKAGHFRRIELLESIPINNIDQKVAVDFGSGSWGFACIYPKLRNAKVGITFDVSCNALLQAAEKDKTREMNNLYFYATNTNDIVPLKDRSIDIFFGGEVIEHVENPLFLLQEIYRITRIGGDVILTTPNTDAYLYKINNLQYCVGPEHIALMNYETLIKYVSTFFSIKSCYGFEGSVFKWFDRNIKDERYIKALQEIAYDKPDIASGIVIHARKEKDYIEPIFLETDKQEISWDDLNINYSGKHDVAHLFDKIHGVRLYADAAAEFNIINQWLILLFWAHDWSGKVDIFVNNELKERHDLYNIDYGFYRAELELQTTDFTERSANIKLLCSGEKDERSKDTQIIFYKAITYSIRQKDSTKVTPSVV